MMTRQTLKAALLATSGFGVALGGATIAHAATSGDLRSDTSLERQPAAETADIHGIRIADAGDDPIRRFIQAVLRGGDDRDDDGDDDRDRGDDRSWDDDDRDDDDRDDDDRDDDDRDDDDRDDDDRDDDDEDDRDDDDDDDDDDGDDD